MPVFIDPRICDRQEICELVKVCPRDAVKQSKAEGTIKVDNTKCSECLLCLKACPYLAVKLAKDTEELGELERESTHAKFDKDSHIAKMYGTKPGRIGKTILKDSDFKRKVDSATPTLVDFWGAHGAVMAPFLKWVEAKYKGELKVSHIKIVENPESRKRYAITTTPTLILFKKGKQIGRLEGIRPKETLRVWLDMKLRPKVQ